MRISYIIQLKDFSLMLFFGFIMGIIYELLMFFKHTKPLITFQIIVDTLFTILFTVILILLIKIYRSIYAF